jgi:hypothetical protein
MEAIIYTQKQLNILDDTVIESARRQINAPMAYASSRTAVLNESGYKTPSELLPRARALYLLHIIERPASHLTTVALQHTWNHKSSPRYNKWLLPTIRTLQRWGNDKLNADSYEITRCNLHRHRQEINLAENGPQGPQPPLLGKAWAQRQADYDIAYARIGHKGPRPIEHSLHTRRPGTMPAPPVTRSTHTPYTIAEEELDPLARAVRPQ